MTAEERDIVWHRALNSILSLNLEIKNGAVEGDEFTELEHRMWVLKMHAEDGERYAKEVARKSAEPQFMEAAE